MRSTVRFSCDAVFGSGERISLRDFHFYTHAAEWCADNQGRDFYPGRVYRLEIRKFEYIPEQEGG